MANDSVNRTWITTAYRNTLMDSLEELSSDRNLWTFENADARIPGRYGFERPAGSEKVKLPDFSYPIDTAPTMAQYATKLINDRLEKKTVEIKGLSKKRANEIINLIQLLLSPYPIQERRSTRDNTDTYLWWGIRDCLFMNQKCTAKVKYQMDVTRVSKNRYDIWASARLTN